MNNRRDLKGRDRIYRYHVHADGGYLGIHFSNESTEEDALAELRRQHPLPDGYHSIRVEFIDAFYPEPPNICLF